VSETPTGLVRVLVAGETAGTGFLVSDDGLVVTCTHILDAAAEGDTVSLVFRFGPAGVREQVYEARVQLTRAADAEDVAFLRLCVPVPRGVSALALGTSRTAQDTTFRAFGFPTAKPLEGMAGRVELTGTTTDQGFEVLQGRSTEVTRGFSGAPVTDEHGAVVGMVTSVTIPDTLGRLGDVVFATPVERLIVLWPELRPELVRLSDRRRMGVISAIK
jgi:S1-C subfamily serine protease